MNFIAMRKRMIIAIFEWISIRLPFFPQDYIFFDRNYFLMYDSIFFRCSDWPTWKKPSEYNEYRSKFVLLRLLKKSSFFSFGASLDNYVQLQFHKSMIYSYGLHFYSIRMPYRAKNCNSFMMRRGFLVTSLSYSGLLLL